MKIPLQNYLFIALVALFLHACAAQPQTPREVIAVSEISYQEALETATRWATEGRLDEAEAKKLHDVFDEYEKTRDAARVTLESYDAIAGGGSIADLDLRRLAELAGITEQELQTAKAAGQLLELLAGKADAKANAVSLALINLRSILAEVEQ